MDRRKQHLTQIALIIGALLIIAGMCVGRYYTVAALVVVIATSVAYRLYMRYKRRCPYCDSRNVKRIHLRAPIQLGGDERVCTTVRVCKNPFCWKYGKEEVEKSYRKAFGRVHMRIEQALRFAGFV